MVSDSISSASIAMASSNHKDLAKKKRGNRAARLKQCKLDARREQWLSQVKIKGASEEKVNRGAGSRRGPVHLETKMVVPIEKLDIKPSDEDEIYVDECTVNHYCNSGFPAAYSPTSHTSGSMVCNDYGVNFTVSSRSSTSSGRSSSSNGSYSGSMSEEDEGEVGDDGCLDDWEAVADALAATDQKQQKHSPDSVFGLYDKHGSSAQSGSQLSIINQQCTGIDISNAEQVSEGNAVHRAPENCRAWRPDDTFRPQSLPNLSKQYSSPSNTKWYIGRGESGCGLKSIGPVPTPCPICCEDLDCTDSSFLPCPCGFRLCLFCHKRILEQDGRCPGCRKLYDRRDHVEGEATLDGGSLTFQLPRSCSMISRS